MILGPLLLGLTLIESALLGSIPLALGISNGETMLTLAVLAILLTAPLGALLIDLTKDKLLEKIDPKM
jgi:hypothetical protein